MDTTFLFALLITIAALSLIGLFFITYSSLSR